MSSNSTNNYAVYLSNLSNNLNNYLSIILPSIGIPCNLIAVFIFWRLRGNKSNLVFLGVFQSLVDTVLLLFVLIIFRSQFTIGVNIANQSDSICKFVTFIKRYIYIASSWMQVFITFDRVIFVLHRYENGFKFMKNKLILTALIFGLWFILGLFILPNVFFYLDPNSNTCTSSSSINIITDIVSIVFRLYLPFALMIIFNLIMVRKIFDDTRNKFNKQTALSRKEFQLTFSVMAFDVYFFIVNFPVSIYYIFFDVNNYSGAVANNDVFKAQYTVVYVVTSDLTFFQQTFSFFMYLMFNKLFRGEVLKLVGLVFHLNNFVNPSSKILSTGYTGKS